MQETETSGDRSAGTLLCKAREAIGLSIADVASLLHISEAYVEALEHDQYKLLPAPIYVKGYIRNYAKLVQVDSDELILAYEQQNKVLGIEKQKAEELVNLAPELPKGIDPQWLGFAALILILFVVFMIIPTGNKESDAVSDQSVSGQADPSARLSGPGEGGEKGISGGPAGADQVGQASKTNDAGAEGAAAVQAEPLTDALEPVDPSVSIADEIIVEPVAEKPVAGTDNLFMFFNGECWVSVKDAYDLEIFAGLKKAGDSLELTGAAPFSVLLGDAAVVNLNFNGKNIALKPYIRKDSGTAVVRLKP